MSSSQSTAKRPKTAIFFPGTPDVLTKHQEHQHADYDKARAYSVLA